MLGFSFYESSDSYFVPRVRLKFAYYHILRDNFEKYLSPKSESKTIPIYF